MKAGFLLLFLGLQAAAVVAQDREDRTPYLTKSLSGDAINSVVVSTSAGGIMVSGKSGEAPRVEVYIRGNNNHELTKQEIEKRLAEDYDMDIKVNGHELNASVRTRHQINWNREGMSISFKIYVPEQSATDLRTSGGGIALDHLKGTERFTTSGGGIAISYLSGSIKGHTSGGGIDVSNSSDEIDLNTSGGGIVANDCKGNIKLHTSGGGLILNNLNGTIDATTSGGGVEGTNIEGELVTSTSGGGIDLKDMNCSLDANTSAGSLNAQMKHVGKYLRLSANSGNIDLELPAKQGLDLDLHGERVNQHQFNGFNGKFDKDFVKGSVNGGGAQVTADASSGDVNVRFN